MGFGSTSNTTRDKISFLCLLVPLASVLLSSSLESLQVEGPQTSWALSSAFSRGSC